MSDCFAWGGRLLGAYNTLTDAILQVDHSRNQNNLLAITKRLWSAVALQ